MTVMIIKRNARKPLVVGPVLSAGAYPGGIGGMGSNDPCLSFTVGDYRVHLTAAELCDLLANLRQNVPSTELGQRAGLPSARAGVQAITRANLRDKPREGAKQ